MSQSTDGQLCYGILFEEGYEFPWGEEDPEDWYDKVRGFKSTYYSQIYTPEGEYLNGKKPSKDLFDKHFDEEREFKKLHPMPFELVNYCSGDYPMYILAIPSTVKSASRGYPEVIDFKEIVFPPDELGAFKDFCNTHGFDAMEAKWYLSSYCG